MSTTTPRALRPAMSDYGVPDDLDGVLPWSWAEERLLASKNLWVVTASVDGRPHAMPVWGAWLPESGQLLFSCSPNARKARNIAANPQVSVAVDSTVEVVVVEGTARSVTPDEVSDGIDAYGEKYWETEQERADSRAFISGHALFLVEPERAFAIIEDDVAFTQQATKWVW